VRKWTPLTAVCLGTLMLLVDVTIVNVALPDIASDLSASFADLQWVIDIYALVLAALLLATGSLADAWGRRRIYVYGLVIFAVSSLVCGLAQNATELVIARGVQGVGGAAMFATTVALLNMSYQGRDRGIAYGVWGAVSGAAAGLGVVLGGILVDWTSWRWIFFVNLPISVAAVALSLLAFRTEARQRVRLDIAGMLTFVLAAGATTYGMIRAGEYGWQDPGTLTALGVGLLSFAAFAVVELRSADPLVDLRLFKNSSFVGFNLAAAALSFAAFGYFALLSIWLQTVYGLTAIQAGLAFLPLTITAFVVSGATGKVLNGVRPRWPIGGGILLIGAGALSMQLLDAGGSWLALLPGEIISGIGVGIVSPIVAAAALGAVPAAQGGMASGLVNTGRQLGLAFGVALLGTVFQSAAATSLTDAGAPEAGTTARGMAAGGTQVIVASIPTESRDAAEQAIHTAFVDGLDTVFLIAGLAGVLAGLACLLLIHGRQPATDDSTPTGRNGRGGYVGRHRAPAGFAIDTRPDHDHEPVQERPPITAHATKTADTPGGQHFAHASRMEPDTVDAP
jgi:EmrB/QacA subfamily drug resistance transporter